MFKERIKTSVIALLFVNLIFMTCRLWFADGLWQESFLEMVGELPVLRDMRRGSVSIPLERLSEPHKLLINDGSLWIAYYNTDALFDPIEARTRQIFEGFLRGETDEKREITTEEWQRALESVSVYVEYPITYTVDTLCAAMGIDSADAPHDVDELRDFVVVPSEGNGEVYIIVRDASADRAFIYRFPEGRYDLSPEDLGIYTENNSGYYEPAFSTGIELEGVSLDPMVLFSDSRPVQAVLTPQNPLESQDARLNAAEAFFNNVSTASVHSDSDGVTTYVENYGEMRIYPNGLFEYKAVSEDKGIEIAGRYASDYETVSAAISFAEELWSGVSREPLSMLVTSDLTGDGSRSLRITMDYYYDGRPVAVSLPAAARSEQLDHGVEMEIRDGMIVSYRQLFRRYASGAELRLGADFVSALDYFVNNFSFRSNTVISDIYIGYMDRGAADELEACWLARVKGDGVTYAYQSRREGAK